MTALSSVPVEPIYGWGWTDASETLETPPPFRAELSWRDNELLGTVIEPGHPFRGGAVTLAPRHQRWDGCVNVQVDVRDQPTIYGYALISTEYLA